MSEVFKATVKLNAGQVANIIRERFNIPATTTVSFVVEHDESQATSDCKLTHAVIEYNILDTEPSKHQKYPPGVRGGNSVFPDR